jgi:hypothetical protein
MNIWRKIVAELTNVYITVVGKPARMDDFGRPT